MAVKSFLNWDVYYCYHYANAHRIHGDGEPLLLLYHEKEYRLAYVVMKRDIAEMPVFQGVLPRNRYFDLESPYGYGGPLSDTESIPIEIQRNFASELQIFCNQEGIVSQFIRFHPLLANQNLLLEVMEIRYMRDTVAMDTSQEADIMTNMDSKNRNMVRKALKNEVTIVGESMENYHPFLSIYRETMQRDGALEYYYFSEEYFRELKEMEQQSAIFYAYYKGERISAAIILWNERFAHYHLAGGLTQFRTLASNNLLIYEVAKWASQKGISRFHLGGGIEAEDDLFRFKKQFNKVGRLPFYVGRMIFNQVKYDELCKLRKQLDEKFDGDNNYMIQYRR